MGHLDTISTQSPNTPCVVANILAWDLGQCVWDSTIAGFSVFSCFCSIFRLGEQGACAGAALGKGEGNP